MEALKTELGNKVYNFILDFFEIPIYLSKGSINSVNKKLDNFIDFLQYLQKVKIEEESLDTERDLLVICEYFPDKKVTQELQNLKVKTSFGEFIKNLDDSMLDFITLIDVFFFTYHDVKVLIRELQNLKVCLKETYTEEELQDFKSLIIKVEF